MKISLVGGGGFVGEYLYRELKKRSDCDVLIIDRNSPLKDSIEDTDIVVVMTRPEHGVVSHLIEALALSKKLKKIIYVSTLLVYPSSPEKSGEDIVPMPATDYEREKCREESIFSDFAKKRGCGLFIARLTNVYGDVKNKGIINGILLSLIKGKELIINGKGGIRDYIFVEDAAALLESLIFWNSDKQEEIFNICTGKGYSVWDLIRIAEDIFKQKINYKISSPVIEKNSIVGNNTKALKISGYLLKFDLINGLKKAYNNYLRALN